MDNSIIKATETITTSTAPAMPAEASPRPWRVEKSPANSNFWVVRCDNGVSVATAWHEADARLIVEAVDERARLRDLVRRLVHQFEVRATYDDEAAILREAREAIGEAAP